MILSAFENRLTAGLV